MKALKILSKVWDEKTNQFKREWQILFGTALNAASNLSDLTDKKAARINLGLYEEFMTKNEMREGSIPNSIHHSAIIQDYSARFVNDRNIDFWNKKLNKPLTGISNFVGNSQERFIKLTITDPLDKVNNPLIVPYYITFHPRYNTHGMLGETWIRYNHTPESDRGIYVGNTGSYTGEFDWYVFY